METFDPHAKSKVLRRFKPTRCRAGMFCLVAGFFDAALLLIAFNLVLSPRVLQPGMNIRLPQTTSFSGGARFGTMILSIPRGGGYYFNDKRIGLERLAAELEKAVRERPDAPLIIEADEEVPWGQVVAAWDVAVEAGVREISHATEIAAVKEIGP
ncbi:MAG: biopolymer transporter ExbD [Pontiellaceae bacterium]|nr:biopolymer transporter ExbD [Pontiellaceae bacterium]